MGLLAGTAKGVYIGLCVLLPLSKIMELKLDLFWGRSMESELWMKEGVRFAILIFCDGDEGDFLYSSFGLSDNYY